MATISRYSAVAQVGKLEFGGFIAWLAWLVLHLYYLVGHRNRIAAMFAWWISFLGRTRGQMAITSQMIYARVVINWMTQAQAAEGALAAAEQRRGGRTARRLAQGLIDVGDQIVGAFQPDRDADHAVAEPDRGAALRAHRPVSRRRRMGDKRFGVAEVVGDVDQPQLVEHFEGPLLRGALRAVELEGDNRSAAGHLTLGQVVLRV